MKKVFWKQLLIPILFSSMMLGGVMGVVSCKDDYLYDDEEPDWLGASIYDYLKTDGNFKYYAQLIDDLGYTEVLKKTGSKTLFVSDDAAFERFFQNNPWGVSSYEKLSIAQKKLILNFGMINNAYLMETLANYYNQSLQEGLALRRTTAISVLDSIKFETGEQLPPTEYWAKYKNKGLYLLNDETAWPMVHFLQKSLENNKITDADFEVITGVARSGNDAFIFDKKIIVRDIVCKNGYVHVLEDVLIPPANMAQHIRDNSNTQTFSSLLERFSGPYYNSEMTIEYKQINPSFTDSIFSKKYFATQATGGAPRYPNNVAITSDNMLPFSPGWNSYETPNKVMQADMAAIFAPTDAAMDEYFNVGKGIILKNRYGTWENVPSDILALLIKRQMRKSLVESVPSRFDKMQDEENSPLPVSVDDIEGSYVGVNGVVYYTNNVYPPDDYVSVYAPVLFGSKTLIYNWAIRQNEFRFYLNSLVSRYSFFVPTDEYFSKYIEPVAYAKGKSAALKFWYNKNTFAVNATVYNYNKLTGEVGDSVTVITNANFISNRLVDMLDSHIVVGGVESGDGYYFTKGGNALKVEGTAENMKISGGGDIEQGVQTNVTSVFPQENGYTYYIDKPLQTPLRSVYNVLSTTPEFSEFFSLLNGFPSTSKSVVFVRKTNYYGIDYNMKFFNTFNYTVYVPTNQALVDAENQGICPIWESRDGIVGINQMTSQTDKDAAMRKLEKFLRYHFQDNSVYITGKNVNKVYQTATIKENNLPTQFNTYQNKYYKLGVAMDGDNLNLSTENYGSSKVLKDNGLYNIMVRDYIFSASPASYKEIDGTGSGNDYALSSITTSSTAVIHQIDNVLRFE